MTLIRAGSTMVGPPVVVEVPMFLLDQPESDYERLWPGLQRFSDRLVALIPQLDSSSPLPLLEALAGLLHPSTVP